MILKTLYLKVGDLGLPVALTYGYLKRSRYICNYIEREVLKPMKYPSDKFDRIVIAASSEPSTGVFVNSSNVACVDVTFDRRAYEAKSGAELTRYYLEVLHEGLDKCASAVPIPRREIFDGLRAFEAQGSKNEWVHKTREFKKIGMRASLICRLTQDVFRLGLTVSQHDRPAADLLLLETDPDENAYEHRFKDIELEGEDLVVTSKSKEPLWRQPVKKFLL